MLRNESALSAVDNSGDEMQEFLTFTNCLYLSDSRESHGGDQRMQRTGVQGPLWELQALQTV